MGLVLTPVSILNGAMVTELSGVRNGFTGITLVPAQVGSCSNGADRLKIAEKSWPPMLIVPIYALKSPIVSGEGNPVAANVRA
jgi:hypothetical protein